MSTIGTELMHQLADAADAETLPRFRQQLAVDTKIKVGETFDPVTEADRAAERAMRAIISREYPEHGIWGEEYGQTTGNGCHRWVLDPVDGTRPFLCGLPVWATLIGFTIDGRAAAGMMSQPFTGERFWGLCQTKRTGSASGRRLVQRRVLQLLSEGCQCRELSRAGFEFAFVRLRASK